jgi:hypothetical protein
MTLEVGGVGRYASLAVIDGKPAISYFADGANQLKFIHADAAVPTSAADWTTTPSYTIDTTTDAGEFGTSLIEIGGKAAIAYHANGSLKFARASVASPTIAGQWTLSTIESGGVGKWPSLANVAGLPAVAYVDETNADLRYAYAGDVDGTSWTALLVDGDNRTGAFGLSLVAFGGLPVIAYHESVSADLLVATGLSATPADDNDWDIVAADEDNGGDYPAMALLSDGNPAIAYGADTTDMRFIRYVP